MAMQRRDELKVSKMVEIVPRPSEIVPRSSRDRQGDTGDGTGESSTHESSSSSEHARARVRWSRSARCLAGRPTGTGAVEAVEIGGEIVEIGGEIVGSSSAASSPSGRG